MKKLIKTYLPFLLMLNIAFSFSQTNNDTLPAPGARAHHALVYDEDAKYILLTAGSTPLDGGRSYNFFNDVWTFNGKEWKQIATAGDKRSGVSLAYDSKRKKIYSLGGYNGKESLPDFRVLENGEWKTISNNPDMKTAEGGLVYDAERDRIIAFGGTSNGNDVNNTTWEWDGHTWKKFEGPSPEARQSFAMIYNSKEKKTIMYGGMGSSPDKIFTDTWEFDGHQWNKVNDKGQAGPRFSCGYAYDSKRNLLIIFGGDAGDVYGDTWSWDGKEWKQLSDTGPKPRSMGCLAYDKNRDRIVMFGGRLNWPNDANDTWEWDGTKWKEVNLK